MAKRSKKQKADAKGIPAKTAASAGAPSPLNRDWILGLILILAIGVAYLPVWWAGYIWDDDLHLTANPVIVGPLGLTDIWTTSVVKFCPFVFTTFWVEHALWGLAPLPYHVVNVLLHGASAVLLWRVLRMLQIPGAWLGAALWTLHPVQAESVAWISEMKNTESCVFFLLTILFFLKGLKEREVADRRAANPNYALTSLFAFLAMASKSSTVILPLVLGLVAWWVEGRWRWRNLKTIVPVLIMSIVAGALTIWNPKPEQAADLTWLQTWPERLVTAGDAAWFYLGKLIWPYPLIAIYPRWEINAGQWSSYLPLLLVIIVSLVLWMGRLSWARPYFLMWAYFLAALLPVLGLAEMTFLRYSFVADHFQYLASMGPLVLAGAGMTRLADSVIPGKTWLPSALAAGVLLALGTLTLQRAQVFENEEALWSDTLAKNPNSWVSHESLGHALYHKGQWNDAMAEYKKTLEIDPTNAEAYNDMGNALFQTGQVDEAHVCYQQALKIDPNFAAAHCSLGVFFVKKGQWSEAINQFQEALRLHPGYGTAQDNLANVKAFLAKEPQPK
jgi:tetratricopeptide (TPR) repeat protein